MTPESIIYDWKLTLTGTVITSTSNNQITKGCLKLERQFLEAVLNKFLWSEGTIESLLFHFDLKQKAKHFSELNVQKV